MIKSELRYNIISEIYVHGTDPVIDTGYGSSRAVTGNMECAVSPNTMQFVFKKHFQNFKIIKEFLNITLKIIIYIIAYA